MSGRLASAAMVRDVHHVERMRPPELSLVLGAAMLVACAACEQSRTPMIAGIAELPGGGSRSTAQPALEISPRQAQLVVGASLQLQTNAPLVLQDQIEWFSVNPSVVAVNAFGVVTALAPGATAVRARYAFDTTRVASTLITVVGAGTGG